MVRPNPSTFWPSTFWPRTFWPWTFWILVLLTCPPPAQGQSCLSFPTAANEIWLGSVAEQVDGSRRAGAAAAVNIGGAVELQLEGLWGGYPSKNRANDIGTRVGVPLSVGSYRICPYAALNTLNFSFRDHFEVSYGDVAETSTRLGLGAATSTASDRGLSIGLAGALEFVHRSWDMKAHKLVIVDDAYMSQPIHRLDYSYHLAGQVGGFVRWGRVAATLGYGTHPRTGRDGTVSFTVGVVAAGG